MRYEKRAALIAAVLLLNWAVSHAGIFSHGHENDDWEPLLGEFEQIEVPRGDDPKGGILFRYKGENATGPGVLILHEVYGLTHETLVLARDLGEEGYSVYVPLLFGPPEPKEKVGGMREACGREDFYCWAPNRTSPIVDWLTGLLPEVRARSNGDGIAVIGMCLTGTFPIAFLPEEDVRVVVLSQPSLPLRVTPWHSRALGLDQEVIDRALERQRGPSPARVLAFRYQRDLISPNARLETIEELFQIDAVRFERKDYREQCEEDHPQDSREMCQKSPHALLTSSRLDEAYDQVLAALCEKMPVQPCSRLKAGSRRLSPAPPVQR